jgi:sulfur carrier protein
LRSEPKRAWVGRRGETNQETPHWYSRDMEIVLNGQPREVPLDPQSATLQSLIDRLEMKADRIAVERNGEIVRRPEWPSTPLAAGDRLEIVHFVGGGL